MSKELDAICSTIHSIKNTGSQINNIEALLIYENDYFELLKFFQDNPKDYTSQIVVDLPCGSDELRMFGVKIIKSKYVKPGSIFKIFKDNSPLLFPESSPYSVAGSGMIPIPDFHTTIPGSGSLDTDFCPIVGESGVFHIRDDVPPPPVVEEKKEKKIQKRHSKKRKIELG